MKTCRSKIRSLCTRFQDDPEVFALIDDLDLVPCRHHKSAYDFLLRQDCVIQSLLREERDCFIRQLSKRRYVRASNSGDLFAQDE